MKKKLLCNFRWPSYNIQKETRNNSDSLKRTPRIHLKYNKIILVALFLNNSDCLSSVKILLEHKERVITNYRALKKKKKKKTPNFSFFLQSYNF